MNISPVNESGLLNSLTNQLVGAQAAKVPPVSADDSKSFQNIWTSQTEKKASGTAPVQKSSSDTDRQDMTGNPAVDEKTPPTEKAEGPRKSQDTEKGKPDQVEAPVQENLEGTRGTAQEGELTEENVVEAMEVLQEIAGQLLTQIQEELGITAEEAQNLLGTMGMETADLLNPQNLNAFLLQAMDVESPAQLLTNEEQFATFKELTGALQNILSQPTEVADLNVDQLQHLVQEMEPVEGPVLPEAMPEPEMPIQDQAPDMEEKAPEEGNRPILPTESAEPTEEADLKGVTLSDGQSLGAQAMVRANARAEGENGQQAGEQGQMQQQPQFQPGPEAVANAELPRTESYANTQEIANQIMDYIRSQSGDDFSNVEMQLHPASLGTLKINVTNTQGVMTANFVAQNEAVKAVIESQIATLQQQFESQGVKVEAVEVTVETRQFDQNLEQNMQGQGDGEEQTGSGRRPRRINLNAGAGEELPEDLSEEERLAAEMMQANGGTVDFTA